MAKAIREHLIQALASGEFVSGQAVGKQLGISRTAVSTHVKALVNMGLDIFSVTGKGYKLAKPLYLLNKSKILLFMSQEVIKSKNILTPEIEVHSLIDSTNDYLMRRLPNQLTQGQVCLAEYQSAGRGRRGRQWVSPLALKFICLCIGIWSKVYPQLWG